MEAFFSYICEHAHHAPWLLFTLLLLTGLNLPISEDVILLVGGAIASTCLSEHSLSLYAWLLLGSMLAAWEAYWIGRLLGERLYKFHFFKSTLPPHRLEVLRHYYAKFGLFTFIVGRFCPGGIRNALFISSGLTKMPFYLFILRDSVACFISITTLFSIGYLFGQHFDVIVHYFHRYTHWFFIVISILAILGLMYGYFMQKRWR